MKHNKENLPSKQPAQCCLCSSTPTHQEHLELREDTKNIFKRFFAHGSHIKAGRNTLMVIKNTSNLQGQNDFKWACN